MFLSLLTLNVNHFLIELSLSDLFVVFTLSILTHKFNQDATEHEELRFLPVLECLNENSLLVNDLIDTVFPNSELLSCLGSAHSHEVVS